MKPLLSFAALAVTALAMQSLPLKAQDSTSTSSSGSTSSSNSASGSVSGSRSGASTTSGTSSNQQRVNQRTTTTTNIPITLSVDPAGPAGANGTNGGGAVGGGSNTPGGPTGQPYYGQSDVTVRTTPTVYAPPVSGGNPCTLAVSGGVSVIGWGAAAGGTFVDKDCADRQKIAMIHNSGQQAAARELMCLDRDTYNAFKRVGQPCVFNAAFEPPGTPPTPMVQQQPVQIAPVPQQQVIKDRTNLPRCSRTVTDNCYAG